jgi:hypothetical protein
LHTIQARSLIWPSANHVHEVETIKLNPGVALFTLKAAAHLDVAIREQVTYVQRLTYSHLVWHHIVCYCTLFTQRQRTWMWPLANRSSISVLLTAAFPMRALLLTCKLSSAEHMLSASDEVLHTAAHLDVAVSKEVLHQRPVNAAHASVVDGKAKRQQVAQLRSLRSLSLSLRSDTEAGEIAQASARASGPASPYNDSMKAQPLAADG